VKKKKHLALYGNVSMPRGYCDSCSSTALIVDKQFLCCGSTSSSAPEAVKRMSEPRHLRKGPSAYHRGKVLRSQKNRCLYCGREFETLTKYWGESKVVKCVWDHALPYAYASNNADTNFVASCQFCNSWKSSLIFATVEDVSVYVGIKWQDASNG
jgi:hypothetical protein